MVVLSTAKNMKYCKYSVDLVGLWCLTQFSTIFQLYRGDQFYLLRKLEDPEKTINLSLKIRAAKRIFGPQGKRKLGPPPPILQIMIFKQSPPRCVISKESVQQKWIDQLWFRKQLSTCLFFWIINYNYDLVHLLIDAFL